MTYPISKFGFIILNPDKSLQQLKTTLDSVRKLHGDISCISVVPQNTPSDLKFDEYCKTHKGGSTYSSLLNTGLKKSPAEWRIVVFAGTWIKPNLEKLVAHYIKSEKEILFPVIKNLKPEERLARLTFFQGSLNGVIMHKDCIKIVGEFPDKSTLESPMFKDQPVLNDLELIKLEWMNKAINIGYVFKAILGVAIC